MNSEWKCWDCEQVFKNDKQLVRHQQIENHHLDGETAQQLDRAQFDVIDDDKKVHNPINLHVDAVLEQLEVFADSKGGVKASNILLIALHVEQVVEQFDTLTGQQKKALVLNAFRAYFAKHGGDTGLLNILPNFIDVSVGLDNGDVSIKFDVEHVVSCCASLLLGSKKAKKQIKKKK